jgi:ssRNA-specific RNase YbeY (16S rRNA maturation enzyme)
MQNINLDETKLYNLIKRAVREVLEEEMVRHRLESLLFVSDEEMKEIEQAYGKPRSSKDAGRTESLEI